MHAFTADGAQALVLDGYGLTRASVDGKRVKTNARVTGTSIVRVGSLLAVGDGGATRVIDVDTLASPSRKRLELFDVLPHPAGGHLLRLDPERVQVKTIAGEAIGEIGIDASAREAPAFGTPVPWALLTDPPTLGADDEGTFALYDCRRGRLVRFAVPEVAAALQPTLARRMLGRGPVIAGARLDVPPPIGPIGLRVAGGHVALTTSRPSKGLLHALVLAADGSVQTFERQGLGSFAFDGRALAWQADESAFVVEPLRGRAERAVLADRGRYEVMLDGASLLGVSEDRESIVDLRDASRRFSRKLAPAERETRHALGSFLRRANERGSHFDVVVTLESARTWGFEDVRPRFAWTGGDQSLFALLLAGETIADALERWKLVTIRPLHVLAPTSAAELSRGLAVLDDLGLSLLRALPSASHAFEHSVGRRVPFQPPPTRQRARIFEPAVGVPFLRAVVASAAGRRTAPEARHDGELDLGALTRATGTDRPVQGLVDDARTALGWVLVETLGERAWPTLFEWIVTSPNPFADANTHIAGKAAVTLCDLHPAARGPLRSACVAATESGDPNRSRRAAGLLRALDAPP